MKYAVNCSILFTELPLLERPAAAKAAGFDFVEFWWPWDRAVPTDEEVDAFVAALKDADVQLIGLNLFAGDMSGGDRGLVSWIARAEEFEANLPVVVRIAKATGCQAFNALYGLRQDGEDPTEADELALANIAKAARAVAEVEGVILVEPVSGAEAYPIKTAAEALEVVRAVRDAHGVLNVGFLCDLYHLAANGDDVVNVAKVKGKDSAHVQIADFPGRGEPGTGELDLQELLDMLHAGGYDGYVALEYKPTVATAESFGALPTLK